MDQFELIKTASRVYGKSIRQIGRETGHHRVTIRKALAGKEAQYRRQEKPRAPVMDPVAKIVEQWGVGDRQRPPLTSTLPDLGVSGFSRAQESAPVRDPSPPPTSPVGPLPGSLCWIPPGLPRLNRSPRLSQF